MSFWVSVLAGGVGAAVATAVFEWLRDKSRQKTREDWERRRYKANQLNAATAGMVEAFYGVKAELNFLVSGLEALDAEMARQSRRASELLGAFPLEGGPLGRLERHSQLLAQLQDGLRQQQAYRFAQYEGKAKDARARAEACLQTIELLAPGSASCSARGVFEALAASWNWNLAGARQELARFERNEGQVLAIRRLLEEEAERLFISPRCRSGTMRVPSHGSPLDAHGESSSAGAASAKRP